MTEVFSPESVPVEGCGRRRWPGLQRVVRDFQRGPSEQAPAKRHSALGRLTALTCREASLARPWTANPGEKTSVSHTYPRRNYADHPIPTEEIRDEGRGGRRRLRGPGHVGRTRARSGGSRPE